MSQAWKRIGEFSVSTVSGKVVTVALVLIAGLIPVIGHLLDLNTTAYAQDKPAKKAPASVHVPMLDARTISADAVHVSGVALSSNREIVIIFYGQDRSLFNDAKEAAREAIADGLPVRGMVFGPPSAPPTGQSNIEVFANGLLASPSNIKWDKEAISDMINFANTEYIKSGQFDFAPHVTR